VQFGSGIDLYASGGGFTIHGYLNFDALFILSPFSFIVEMKAGVNIDYEGETLFGINLDLMLSGPNPWHAHGTAGFDILFISVSVTVDATFGDQNQAVIPSSPVLPPLVAALSDPRNWNAALPDNASRAVSLATRQPSDNTILVHPMGTLTVQETVVPLDIPITKFGSAAPADGNQFAITNVIINGQAESQQSVPGYFAIGQFEDMSDADKLSAPSYEPFDSGSIIGSADVKQGQDSREEVHYDTVIIDDLLLPSRFDAIYRMGATLQSALIGQGAAARSLVQNTGLSRFLEPGMTSTIATSEVKYVITSTDDLGVRTDLSASEGTTHFQAFAALSAHLSLHPEDAQLLQVMPLHEAVTA